MSAITNFLEEENQKREEVKAVFDDMRARFDEATKKLYSEIEIWLADATQKNLITVSRATQYQPPQLLVKTSKGQVVFTPSSEAFLGSLGHIEIRCAKPFVLTLKESGWKLFEDHKFVVKAPEYIDWNEEALLKVIKEGIR